MYYIKHNLIKACIALIVILSSSIIHADNHQPNQEHTPSAEAMMYDGLIVRPVSLASTIVGTGIFIVTLPFTLFSDSVEQTGKKLVVEPAAYTFKRCLGCLDRHKRKRY